MIGIVPHGRLRGVAGGGRRGRRRHVYRSRRRTIAAPLLGLLMGGIWFLLPAPLNVVGFGSTVVIFSALGLWPRVITTPDEVIVWNLTRWRSSWGQVRHVLIDDQMPELGVTWRFIHGAVGGPNPYTGLVIETHDQGRLAAFALQSLSPFWNPPWGAPREAPPWLATVRDEIDHDRQHHWAWDETRT